MMKTGTLALLILFITITVSCDKNRNHPGYDYFPDMFYSNAYETYTPNQVLKDGKTLQTPVRGTVPVNFIPYTYAKDQREIAGRELNNPVDLNEEVLARGEKMYTVFCANCHGSSGDGKGNLYISKKYTYPPASLLSDKMRKATEGEIYHVITKGYGIMAEHGSIIRPEDRWKITLYIQNVLQK